jgi:hypothetical protein
LVRQGDGWSEGVAAEGARWYVVTNLIDERFVRLDLPALSGSDRRDFLSAQLSSLFSESHYRAVLPYQAGVAKKKLVFTGIGGPYVEGAIHSLSKTGANIVGVWTLPTLLMNALIHRRRTFPPTLLAMLPTTEGMRMLFINEWQPVLTRLLPLGLNTDRLIDEILRTRRYLVDGNNIPNDELLPLLVIDDDHAWAEQLESQNFRIYSPWKSKSGPQPLDNLFNGVISEPHGQLAPLELRQAHVASKLRRAMVGGTVGLTMLSLSLAGHLAYASFERAGSIERVRRDAEVLRTQTAQHTLGMEQMKSQEGALEAVSRLFQGELSVKDSAPEFLNGMSAALGKQPTVRVSRIEWSYLEKGVPCADDAKNAGAASLGSMAPAGLPPGSMGGPKPPGAAASGPAFPLEIVVGLKVPPPASPLEIERQQKALVDSLSQQTGLQVKLQKGLVSLDNDFSGGGSASGAVGAQDKAPEMTVCLTPAGQGGHKP